MVLSELERAAERDDGGQQRQHRRARRISQAAEQGDRRVGGYVRELVPRPEPGQPVARQQRQHRHRDDGEREAGAAE
jgi:hypothetical protein